MLITLVVLVGVNVLLGVSYIVVNVIDGIRTRVMLNKVEHALNNLRSAITTLIEIDNPRRDRLR